MSIGKSSIARAVNATASTHVQSAANDNIITTLSLDNIGLLSVAKVPDDIDSIKSSIAKRGVLCPVLVAVTAKGDKWLMDGYRRYYAAKELVISQINAVVINVDTKTQANNIYNELYKTKLVEKINDIHEEKFRVLCVKDHDLPAYLL